jgi:hypothetical protein
VACSCGRVTNHRVTKKKWGILHLLKSISFSTVPWTQLSNLWDWHFCVTSLETPCLIRAPKDPVESEVKNECIHTFTPSMCLHGVQKANLTQHSVIPRRLQTTSTWLSNLKFCTVVSLDILRLQTNSTSGWASNPSVSRWWMVPINHTWAISFRKALKMQNKIIGI